MALDALPLDVILGVVTHLRAARDVARLLRTSRKLHAASRNAWRTFVATRFYPTLRVCRDLAAAGTHLDYAALARRLTRQDRCWADLEFAAFTWTEDGGGPREPARRGERPRRAWGPGRPWWRPSPAKRNQLCVDARLLDSLREELAVWGAGEDLCARTTPEFGRPGRVRFAKSGGTKLGFRPMVDDVTAVSVVERGPELGIAVARGRGQLAMLDGDPDRFGRVLRTYDAAPLGVGGGGGGRGKSRLTSGLLSQAVRFTTWNAQSNLLATGDASSVLRLYSIDDPVPRVVGDLSEGPPETQGELGVLKSAKFLRSDVLVAGFAHTQIPLRIIQIRPEGLEIVSAAHNAGMPLGKDPPCDENTTVAAVEPVGYGNLVLSAWQDGTCRLTDVRTPSPYDIAFRDEFAFYSPYSALLPYGSFPHATHFLAAQAPLGSIQIFDFRQPRLYYHSLGLPCSDTAPPVDTIARGQAPKHQHVDHNGLSDCFPDRRHALCTPTVQCRFHHLTTCQYRRPNHSIHTTDGDTVYALAKASDVSRSFLVARSGCVEEFVLGTGGRTSWGEQLMGQAWEAGWHVAQRRLSVYETGVGVATADMGPSLACPRRRGSVSRRRSESTTYD